MMGASLFNWEEMKKLAMLKSKRSALLTRIQQCPRFSHKRIVLEARACALTSDIIKAECALDRKGEGA